MGPLARLLLAYAACLLAACAGRQLPLEGGARGAGASGRVLRIADEYVARFYAQFPDAATRDGWPRADHGATADVSPAALARWQSFEDDVSARLRAESPEALGEVARLSRAIVLEEVEGSRGARVCREALWEVRTIWAWTALGPRTAGVQPVGTPELRAKAVARTRALARMADVRIANLREGLRLGYAASRENVAAAIAQIDGLLAAGVPGSPFLSPAARDGDPAFRAELERAVAEDLVPALRRTRDFLEAEYAPRARELPGVLALPGGAACYRATIRRHVTADLDPVAVHEIGLAEMSRIREEMRLIAERSFGTKDLGALLVRFRTEPTFVYASTEEILATARAAVERARAAAPRWFGKLPRAGIRAEPYPEFLRSSAPIDSYDPPTEAGGGDGVFRVNAFVPPSRSRAGLESIAFHEAVPGHHLQIALALESADVPVARWIGNTAFVEGWGLYAERLADEMGLFTADVDRMGMLSFQAFRAARLVVDTGMHALGWSRQQAVDYLVANTTLAPELASSEVNRYSAVPGQALAYMLGAMEIRRLRAAAERTLGPRFDVRPFHDALLGGGPVPLHELEERIGAWVTAQARGAKPASSPPGR